MKLYNSYSRRIEPFEAQGEAVTMYVCGITPYDTTHLGHAFTYAVADVLIRYLEFRGRRVKYVQNVTDIDDDILRKAKEAGEDWRALGDRWTAHFIQDMQALNVRPPDHYPRATDAIPEIVKMVQALIQAGVAYASNGNVYFHIDDWPAYGRLSRLSREEMLPIASERGNHPDDPHKRDPLDFVLWQAQAPGEPAWDSPWGPGRPGWHIECSTLSTRLLGNTIDIHGGGGDLLFPHHESEIAQVESITQRAPFVRFWLHAAMVGHQGKKMSKSLGNLVMVRGLLKAHSADALRLYLAMHHYRQLWSHDEAELKQAGQLAEKLRLAVTAPGGDGEALDPAPAQTAFGEAMEDDLDTATAQQAMADLAKQILQSGLSGRSVSAAQAALREMGGVFGLRPDADNAESRVIEGWNRHLARFERREVKT
jgi:L-cysteine:1D-myo-inositol 2-amino-2-deoxy-alpha-D-glucopyranoside ligase